MTVEAVSETPAPVPAREVLVGVRGLKKHFPIHKGVFRRQVGAVKAIDGVDFDIFRERPWPGRRERLGKSTTGRTILQLEKATAGSVTFEDTELTTLSTEKMRKLRPGCRWCSRTPTHRSTRDDRRVDHRRTAPGTRRATGDERRQRVEAR